MNLVTLIQIGGLLHLGLLVAGACLPVVVGFTDHLRRLPSFLHRLFLVYYGFIGGTVLALGIISVFYADELAAGGSLARAVLIYLTVFWLARFAVALFVFDLRPYLTNFWRWFGYHLLNLTFLYLPVIYGYTLWRTL